MSLFRIISIRGSWYSFFAPFQYHRVSGKEGRRPLIEKEEGLPWKQVYVPLECDNSLPRQGSVGQGRAG